MESTYKDVKILGYKIGRVDCVIQLSSKHFKGENLKAFEAKLHNYISESLRLDPKLIKAGFKCDIYSVLNAVTGMLAGKQCFETILGVDQINSELDSLGWLDSNWHASGETVF